MLEINVRLAPETQGTFTESAASRLMKMVEDAILEVFPAVKKEEITTMANQMFTAGRGASIRIEVSYPRSMHLHGTAGPDLCVSLLPQQNELKKVIRKAITKYNKVTSEWLTFTFSIKCVQYDGSHEKL